MLKPTLGVRRITKIKGSLASRLASLTSGPDSVKVGFPAGHVDGKIIERAIFNEFGTRGSGKGLKTPRGGGFGGPIPERPFMRNAARANRGKYQRMMGMAGRSIIRAVLTGRSGAVAKREALAKLGTEAVNDIRDEITSLSSPPNSPLMIKLKGSDNPLIDTGEMRARVTYAVED